MGGWEHYNKKERRRILWRDMVLEDTPGLMWGPRGTLHVRSSSFEGTKMTHGGSCFMPLKIPRQTLGFWRPVWVGCALSEFPVCLEAWSWVLISPFPISKVKRMPEKELWVSTHSTLAMRSHWSHDRSEEESCSVWAGCFFALLQESRLQDLILQVGGFALHINTVSLVVRV